MAETSKGPAITSANIPKPVSAPLQGQQPAVQATAAKLASSAAEGIVVAPLIEPDFVNLTPTNPEIAFRWILHTLYKQDGGQSILRFEQAKAQGYAVATKADIKNPPIAYEREGGTKYINGDLILMKISARKYKGAIMYREKQAAQAMLSTENKGRAMVKSAIAAQATRNQLAKISVFDPSSDLQAFANDQSDPDAKSFVEGYVEPGE